MKKPEIVIIQSEFAHMPEMEAYPAVLSDYFDVRLESDSNQDFKNAIVWTFMGYRPHRPKCRYLIHDYRSLSTGRFSAFKDWVKKQRNVRPDMRIFLNLELETIMGFKDGVPSFTMDMGIPESIGQFRWTEQAHDYAFCYIGAMSFERESHKMLDAFLDSSHRDSRFLLIGNAEAGIRERYQHQDSLVFAGRMSQEAVFAQLVKCRCGVCYFPRHRPHCFQTPTKLLEYAALGMPIVANPSPSNLRVANELEISVSWGGDYVFDGLAVEGSTSNLGFESKQLSWKGRFEDSGVLDQLLSLV